MMLAVQTKGDFTLTEKGSTSWPVILEHLQS